jgi:GAF domain-containing protein
MHSGLLGKLVVEPFAALRNATDDSADKRHITDELEDLRRLHALSLRLTSANSLADVLLDVLRTAAEMVGAQMGSVQLVTADGDLKMVGQIGFGESIVNKFALVHLADCTTCSVALQRKSRVIVQDLQTDPAFTEIGAALLAYGAVAAVSSPVLDSAENVLAMFSMYWLDRHIPNDRELRALDLCAELAGRHVERSVAAKLFATASGCLCASSLIAEKTSSP